VFEQMFDYLGPGFVGRPDRGEPDSWTAPVRSCGRIGIRWSRRAGHRGGPRPPPRAHPPGLGPGS